MKIKTLLLSSALLCGSLSVVAQDVKATIEETAKASQQAIALAKGPADKEWKISGVMGVNASATGMWNWAAGGNNNANGVIFGNVSLLYRKEKTRLGNQSGYRDWFYVYGWNNLHLAQIE